MGNVRDTMRGANQAGDEEYRREVQRRAQLQNRERQLARNIETQKRIAYPVRNMQVQRPANNNIPSQRRNIRNHPTTIKKANKIKRALAVGMATLAFVGVAAGIGGRGKETPKETTQQTVTYTIKDTQNIKKDEIKTIDDVKKDFIKQYIQAYNEMNNTNYYSAEMYVNYIAGEQVYKMEDGRPVTKGSHPYETEKVLKQIGDFKTVDGYSTVLQVVVDNKEILGSYNTSTGEFVYSGNQLEDLTSVNFDEPTLEKLGISGELVKTVADVEMSRGQREESTKIYISRYKQAKEEMKQNNKQEEATKDYEEEER